MSVKVLFVDIDTQHDFMDPDGALPVPGAGRLLTNLSTLAQYARTHGVPVLASADAHSEDDDEFEQFPPHCVAGTAGQNKIAETTLSGAETARMKDLESQIERLQAGEIPQLVVEKQELDVFSEPTTDAVLAALDPQRIILYGVTTEYCVRDAALGLRERGFDVTLATDAVAPVEENAGEKAINEMKEAGVKFDTTKSILQTLK